MNDLQRHLYSPPAVASENGSRTVTIPPGYELAVDSDQSVQDEPHLRDYLSMIWQRRWLVLLVIVACFGIAVWINRITPSVSIYEANASVRIRPDVHHDFYSIGNPLETQIAILGSRGVARNVVTSTFTLTRTAVDTTLSSESQIADGDADAMIPPWRQALDRGLTVLSQLKNKVLGAPPPLPPPSDPKEALVQARINSFIASLRVVPLPGTDIINLSYRATNPDTAAAMLRALLETVVRENDEDTSKTNAQFNAQLLENVERSKHVLLDSQRALNAVADSSTTTILGLSGNGEESHRRYEAMELDAEKIEAEYRKFKFQNDQLQAGKMAPENVVPELSTEITALRQRLDELSVQLAVSGKSEGPGLRHYSEMLVQFNQLKDQMIAARKRIVDRVNSEYLRTAGERDAINNQLADQRKVLIALREPLNQFSQLKTEVEVNEKLFDSANQQWKEASLASGVSMPKVTVLQPATPPISPLPSSKNRTLLVGLIFGVMLALGLVFFLNYMDLSFRSADEIARVMDLPILGYIPFCNLINASKKNRCQAELVSHQRPYSSYAECYRSLRTTLQYALGRGYPRKVLVTSALPMEGKTTAACNLAITLAQKGVNTLLIDADLKNPHLKKIFGETHDAGLSDLLTSKLIPFMEGNCENEFVHATPVANLSLMTSGSKVSNPVDLLDSEAMRELLLHLEKEYDYIVLDAAPVMDISDTSALGPYVNGVLFVMRPGKTSRRVARDAKEKLEAMGARLIGVAVNYSRKAIEKRYRYGSRGSYGYPSSRIYNGEAAIAGLEMRTAVTPPRFLLPSGKIDLNGANVGVADDGSDV